MPPCFSLQSFLSNQDVGDSLDEVEALLKKHEDFEKSLAAQEEKVKAVDEVASRLLQAGHYAAEDIDSRRKEVTTPPYVYVYPSPDPSSQVLVHHSELLTQTKARQAQLQASLSLQQFLRDAEEATSWIEEKSKVAGDESYRVSPSEITQIYNCRVYVPIGSH